MDCVVFVMIASCLMSRANSANPGGGLVSRLMSQRDVLIQDGLSYTNRSATNPQVAPSIRLEDVRNVTNGHEIRCIINIENWTKWLLGYPVFYLKHGTFQKGFHEREVFPSHREIVITGNHADHSFTGTSGIIGWELEDQGVHLLLMWSIPYNLGIYNAYFGVGVVKLTTQFTQDMLPYWYGQMISNEQGRVFQREQPGQNIVFRHEKFFVIASLEEEYQPMLNVSVMPWSTKDLAPSVWHKLYLDSLRPEVNSQAFSSSSVDYLHVGLVMLAYAFL